MSWQRALGGQRLLVSGFGKWGGGVYDLTHGGPFALDDLPTSGLTLGDDRLWRVLRAPGEQTASCELLSYDPRGVRSYQRLDAIRDPHDLCWHDGALHVASSWDATVWRVPDGGSPEPVWRGGPVPDSWHVNSLVVVDGRLHVCALGRFDRHKAWKLRRSSPVGLPPDHGPGRPGHLPAGVGATEHQEERPSAVPGGSEQGQGGHERSSPAGFVHDIDRGVDVLQGLAHPHAPRWVGGRWYVCESTQGALTELTTDGQVRRRVRTGRFSRGLALLERWALVGGNAHRDTEGDRAEIVVVDLRSFTVEERIVLPCLEVYDILPVPPELARAVALGFGGNPARAIEQHRGDMRDAACHPAPAEAQLRLVTPATAELLKAAGEELDPAVANRCVVVGRPPGRVVAGTSETTTVVVENRSDMPLASVAPRPIRVGARWFGPGRQRSLPKLAKAGATSEAAASTVRNPLAPLPRLLWPGDRAEVDVLLEAPHQPGRYEVRIALHQPDLGWFGVRSEAVVRVEPAGGCSILLGAEGGEEHDVADGVGVGEQHDQTVDADAQPTGGR